MKLLIVLLGVALIFPAFADNKFYSSDELLRCEIHGSKRLSGGRVALVADVKGDGIGSAKEPVYTIDAEELTNPNQSLAMLAFELDAPLGDFQVYFEVDTTTDGKILFHFSDVSHFSNNIPQFIHAVKLSLGEFRSLGREVELRLALPTSKFSGLVARCKVTKP